MQLSNFKLTHTIGESPMDLEYFAEVTVTTGSLWWKRQERRQIYREYVGHWHFVDTGEYTPMPEAKMLEKAWNAQQKLARLGVDTGGMGYAQR